jgi:hypothetical protein
LVSLDDAILLLKGLRDKVLPVRVNMVTAFTRFAFQGFVAEVNESEVMLMMPAALKMSCAMLVKLEGAKFEWGDTREAPESKREELAEKFASALTIVLPDKTRVVVSELYPKK